jgi:hypothetical protein
MLVLVAVHAYGRWSSEWRSLDFILIALALNRRGRVVISKLYLVSLSELQVSQRTEEKKMLQFSWLHARAPSLNRPRKVRF